MTLEYWNAYLADGQLTTQKLIRGQAIPEGLYHLVVEVIVQHEDGSLLFMERHPEKASYPGYYEITAGGSALLGESAVQAIQRELLEETGILSEQFSLINEYVAHDDACLFKCFYTKTAFPKDSVVLQNKETSSYQWVSLTDIDPFITTENIVPHQLRRLQQWIASK